MRFDKLFKTLVVGGTAIGVGGCAATSPQTDISQPTKTPEVETNAAPAAEPTYDFATCSEICSGEGNSTFCPNIATGEGSNCCWLMGASGHPCCDILSGRNSLN